MYLTGTLKWVTEVVGLQLLRLDNMDSTSEQREYEFNQQDSIWSLHRSIAFDCLMLFIISRIEHSASQAVITLRIAQLSIEP